MKTTPQLLTRLCCCFLTSAYTQADTIYEKSDKGGHAVIIRTKPKPTPVAPNPRAEYDARSMIIAPTIEIDGYGNKTIRRQSQNIQRPNTHQHSYQPQPLHQPRLQQQPWSLFTLLNPVFRTFSDHS